MNGEAAREELVAALRSLRHERWPAPVTQAQVAASLGVSNQLVSSWENLASRQVPSQERLAQYVRLFARREYALTDDGKLALPDVDELSPEERREYEQLLARLTAIRRGIPSGSGTRGRSEGLPARQRRFWSFDDGRPIVIIGSEQPDDNLRSIPEADPHHPDHIHALRHADADAVAHLQAQLVALNPSSDVSVLLPSEVLPERDLQGHVIITGGESLNRYARWFVVEAGIGAHSPVVSFSKSSDASAWLERRFLVPRALVSPELVDEVETNEGTEVAVFRAEFRGTVDVRQVADGDPSRLRTDPGPNLHHDLAVIARGPNPASPEATATLLYGLFGQGTYGASLTFSGPEREANEAFIAEQFGGARQFWLLVRVSCNRQVPLTTAPRLADPDSRLLEWSSA